jgi:hypothetical protein
MDVNRRAVSTALALLLAVESIAAVSAAAAFALTPRSAAHPLPVTAPAGEVLAETGTADRTFEPAAAPAAALSAPDTRDYAHPRAAAIGAKPVAKPAKAAPAKHAPAVRRAASTTTRIAVKPRVVSHTGRNHVWIPSLGVSQSVSFFSCTRSATPDNYVYRWGCAGSNNIYLLGHAYSVFKPLHDAYVNGRLFAGMKVFYADGSGRTTVYAVKWWKLTKPTTDASWAWAAQSVPSMTLQTCVGAQSQYRLMVRLVAAG